MQVIVIGAGAAGFFAALSVKEHHPEAKVTLCEASQQVLAKVKISGGGRCNVTHACFSRNELVRYYPRGAKTLKKAFRHFFTQDTLDWFEKRGVQLKTEEDGRIFPSTDQSQTIVDCLTNEADRKGVRLSLQTRIQHIHPLCRES